MALGHHQAEVCLSAFNRSQPGVASIEQGYLDVFSQRYPLCWRQLEMTLETEEVILRPAGPSPFAQVMLASRKKYRLGPNDAMAGNFNPPVLRLIDQGCDGSPAPYLRSLVLGPHQESLIEDAAREAEAMKGQSCGYNPLTAHDPYAGDARSIQGSQIEAEFTQIMLRIRADKLATNFIMCHRLFFQQ